MKRLSNRGFTLIELAIAVVIIGVLAAIAIPAYQNYAKQARRADAKSGLLGLQLAQEKLRANCAHYAQNIGTSTVCGANSAGTTVDWTSTSPDSYYSLAIVGASTAGYSLSATPQGKQTGDDCGVFNVTVDNNGESYTAAGEPAIECWGR
ncbi:type IV pilin protein [Methylophaga sp.]|uniref:type IV pilin protein n=1 Tax=Methylophaga sp. TaxID=2024840 RepID=UPI003F69657F